MNPRARRFLKIVFFGACAAVVGVGIYNYTQGQQKKGGGGRRADTTAPVSVKVATAQTADVPVYLNGVGTTKARNTANVSSLVDGTLLSVDYVEGQEVKKNDVLAQVDPVTYKAALDQAKAKRDYDKAQLENARLDLVRYTNLVKTKAVPQQQVDTQKALVAQLEAQVELDVAAIHSAQAYFDWCTIRSPIDGRTGIRLVDPGNVVHGANATTIVVVTEIKPIAMLFTLPQQQLEQVTNADQKAKREDKGPLTVEALGADNKKVVDRGTLLVVNNQVDQTTGTVQFKAEFPNKDLQLWPGQFVNVRLLIDTLHEVVVIPPVAVQRGPNGNFVYVVQPGDDGGRDNSKKVVVRAVRVTQQSESQAVIESGVATGDVVVTSGFTQLADNRAVTISTTQVAQPAAGPPAAVDGEGAPAGPIDATGQRAEPKRAQGKRRGNSAAPSAAP